MPVVVMVALLLAGCDRAVLFGPDGGEWPARPVPEWVGAPRLAITNSGDDTLAFVSRELPTPRLLDRVPVGTIPVELEGPHHLQVSPDGRWLYVGLSNYVPGSGSGPHGSHGGGTVPGSLLKVDARDLSRAGEVQVDRNPGDLVLSRDGSKVFVSHYDLLRLRDQVQAGRPEEEGWSKVAVLASDGSMRLEAAIPVCATVHGMALSEDESTLFATCTQTDQVAVVDLAARTVRRVGVGPGKPDPLFPRYGPYAIVRSPADGSLWVSCTSSGEVRVFDPRTGAIDESRKVRVTGPPMFSTFLSDGTTLLVPHQDDRISIVDTRTSKVVTTITLPETACKLAHQVIVTPDDKVAYVVCEGDHVKRPGTLVAIDLPARAILGAVETGIYPDAVVLVP